MQDQGKVYGFTISLFEYIETIPTLWKSVKGERGYGPDGQMRNTRVLIQFGT